jgi:hypothetical protein
MKQLFMTALVAVSLISAAFATPVKDVSINVTRSFQSAYPAVNTVQWVVTKDYTKATFTINDIKTEAFYNNNGEFIGSSQAASLEDLPTYAKRGLAKKYSNYIVKEAIKFEGNDETAYFISAENEKQTLILKVVSGNIYVFKATNKEVSSPAK